MTGDYAQAQVSARSRAAFYAFFAWLFLEQPDVEFITHLQALDVQEELRSLVSDSVTDTRIILGLQMMSASLQADDNRSAEEIRQGLAVERTRLLRGVVSGYGPPPPYECLYRSPLPGGESSILLQLAEFYHAVGVILPEEQVDRHDYLGLELDLMRFLCEAETSALDRKDTAAAAQLALLQGQFLRQHLLAWAPAYCEALQNQATTGFYRGVAQLLRGFLAGEARVVAAQAGEMQPPSPVPPEIIEGVE